MFRSYDEFTMIKFREWLLNKYETIENLNIAWERTYSDWSQITVQTWKWASLLPETDYYEFSKYILAKIVKKWSDAIKGIDNAHCTIADNIHSMSSPMGSFNRPQDDYAINNAVDKIGMSFYPKNISQYLPALFYPKCDGKFSTDFLMLPQELGL